MDGEFRDLFETAGAIVAVIAGVGILLLLPLYFSQRRDLERLVAWMEREPEHPAADLAASEAILDRAEAELEEVLGITPEAPTEVAPAPAPATQRGPAPIPPAGVPPATPAALRVTSERPALERITMERAALEPHPRWREFASRATQPRVLAAMALAAVLLGVAAIFGSEVLLDPGDERRGPRAGAIEPAEVDVAVLNGTTVAGLAAKVGDDVRANEYSLGAVTTIPEPFDQTVVMFEPGHEREARGVAKDLGVDPVQPINRQAQRLTEGADVVVIAGQDRAKA